MSWQTAISLFKDELDWLPALVDFPRQESEVERLDGVVSRLPAHVAWRLRAEERARHESVWLRPSTSEVAVLMFINCVVRLISTHAIFLFVIIQ